MVSRGLGVDVDGNPVVSASFDVVSQGSEFPDEKVVAEPVSTSF